MMTIDKRNLHLDGLKLFLICMVVVGHCIQPFRYDNMVFGWLYGIIYSFHMPMFVILSGYFFKIEERRKEALKSMRLMETFVFMTLFFWIAGGMTYTWPLVRLGGCPSWYLLSLVCWRVASNIILKKISLKRMLVYSIILSVMVFIVLNKGEGVFSMMRIVQYYPYFLFGYAIRKGLFNEVHVSPKLIIALSCATIPIIMAFSNYALYTQEFQSIGLLHWCKWFNMSMLVGGGIFVLLKLHHLLTRIPCGNMCICLTSWQTMESRHC